MTVLAELLNERKSQQTKINELIARIQATAIVDADEEALEQKKIDVSDLMEKLESGIDTWHAINRAIMDANNEAQVTFEGTTTSMAVAVTLRESMLKYHKALDSINNSLEETRTSRRLYGDARKKDDIKQIKLLNTASLHAMIDKLAERVRLLDIEIQKVNWSYEV